VIYGISIFQAYRYFSKYSTTDSSLLRGFVAVLMVIDTFHIILDCHFFYHYTVSNFGNLEALGVAIWSIAVQIAVGGIISSSVQFFYAYRIHQLSVSMIVPMLICTLSLTQTIMGIVTCVKVLQLKFFAAGNLSLPFGISTLASEVACDVSITMAMLYYLHKGKTGFKATNRAVTMLMQYMVNSGGLTTMAAIAGVVAWTVSPGTLVNVLFFMIMIRLYPCSFLSILNSREKVRMALHGSTLNTINLSRVTTVHREGESTQSQGHSNFFKADQQDSAIYTMDA
jgi:hypothetical protein